MQNKPAHILFSLTSWGWQALFSKGQAPLPLTICWKNKNDFNFAFYLWNVLGCFWAAATSKHLNIQHISNHPLMMLTCHWQTTPVAFPIIALEWTYQIKFRCSKYSIRIQFQNQRIWSSGGTLPSLDSATPTTTYKELVKSYGGKVVKDSVTSQNKYVQPNIWFLYIGKLD